MPACILWLSLLVIALIRFCVDRKFSDDFNLLILGISVLLWFLLNRFKPQFAPLIVYPLVLSQVVITTLAVRTKLHSFLQPEYTTD